MSTEQKEPEYIVLCETSTKTLSASVSNYMKDGWKLGKFRIAATSGNILNGTNFIKCQTLTRNY